jgi:hypothetical protein
LANQFRQAGFRFQLNCPRFAKPAYPEKPVSCKSRLPDDDYAVTNDLVIAVGLAVIDLAAFQRYASV